MLDFKKFISEKPAPAKQSTPPQTNRQVSEPSNSPAATSQGASSIQSDGLLETLGQQVYFQFAQNQAVNLLTAARNLRVQIQAAHYAGELIPPVRRQLYQELLIAAAIVEVRDAE